MSEQKRKYQLSLEATPKTTDENAIAFFRGEYDFLSNFFEHEVTVDGITYPTSEHAFQAMKVHETEFRYQIQKAPTPTAAKARGKKVPLRSDWDSARFLEMERILRAKFEDVELRKKLLSTGNRELIEGNNWRDTTWGCVRDGEGRWKGRNELGKLLMRLRDEFRNTDSGDVTADVGTADNTMEIKKTELIAIARTIRDNAYAPYSKYRVGAAVQTEDGRIFGGCNVENASYGLSNCAERTAVFNAIANSATTIIAVAVVTEDGGTPCGACRQVLAEFAPRTDKGMSVLLCKGNGEIARETTLSELLPLAFTL